MEQVNKDFADSYNEEFGHLEDVYGAAYWALEYGATKEDLLDQIEQALEMYQDELERGRIVGPDIDAAEGQSPA